MGLPAEYKRVVMLNSFLQLKPMLGLAESANFGRWGHLAWRCVSDRWTHAGNSQPGLIIAVWGWTRNFSMDVPAPVTMSVTHQGKTSEKTTALLWSHLCFCVDVAENNHLFIALFFLLKNPLPTKGHLSSVWHGHQWLPGTCLRNEMKILLI